MLAEANDSRLLSLLAVNSVLAGTMSVSNPGTDGKPAVKESILTVSIWSTGRLTVILPNTSETE